jgi:hypothetical protein
LFRKIIVHPRAKTNRNIFLLIQFLSVLTQGLQMVSSMIRGTLNGWELGGRYGVIMIRPAGGQPPAGLSAARGLAARSCAQGVMDGFGYYQLVILISNVIF